MFKSTAEASSFIIETIAPTATSVVRIVEDGTLRLNLRIFEASVKRTTRPIFKEKMISAYSVEGVQALRNPTLKAA